MNPYTFTRLWRLEMNLASFGALFHGFAVALRAVQNHAVFRDLRWDPEDRPGAGMNFGSGFCLQQHPAREGYII